MKKLSETANQIVEAGDVSNPELSNVDIQVRSGGTIVPPSWLRSAKDNLRAKVNRQQQKNKSKKMICGLGK